MLINNIERKCFKHSYFLEEKANISFMFYLQGYIFHTRNIWTIRFLVDVGYSFWIAIRNHKKNWNFAFCGVLISRIEICSHDYLCCLYVDILTRDYILFCSQSLAFACCIALILSFWKLKEFARINKAASIKALGIQVSKP